MLIGQNIILHRVTLLKIVQLFWVLITVLVVLNIGLFYHDLLMVVVQLFTPIFLQSLEYVAQFSIQNLLLSIGDLYIPPQFVPYRDLGRTVSRSASVSPNSGNLMVKPVSDIVTDQSNTVKPAIVEEVQCSSTKSGSNSPWMYIEEFDEVLANSLDVIEDIEIKFAKKSSGTGSTSRITDCEVNVGDKKKLDLVSVELPILADHLPSSPPIAASAVQIVPEHAASTSPGNATVNQIRTVNLNIMNIQDFKEVWKVLQG